MRRSIGRSVTPLILTVALVAPVGTRAEATCQPGQGGCLPTPQQCETGNFNGYWDGGAPGRLALCVGAAGHIAFYAGGTVSPLCGSAIVADQPVAGDPSFDPNACVLGWPPEITVRHERVLSHDGVALDGWVLLPPHNTADKLPVVLYSSPYFGQQSAPGDQLAGWSEPTFLLEHGYAVALFNVRGTGNSGGCYEMNGRNEQLDQPVLVEWLAAQEWSNQRVAMAGLSYDGTTPWGAAINPDLAPHLKTIVVAGTISDRYLMAHSPQGAAVTDTIGTDPLDPHFPDYTIHQGVLPPAMGAPLDPGYWLVDHAPVLADRVCEEVVRVIVRRKADGLLDDRDGEFWRARRFIDRFEEVRASVFLTHGFHDAHTWQEDEIWNALDVAPKRMLEGQWGHEFPTVADWNDRLIAWLDSWLKGDGTGAPGLGVVDFQDDAGTWHASAAWPPVEAQEEVLYLAGESLATVNGSGSRSYRSVPSARSTIEGTQGAYQSMLETLCPTPISTATRTAGLLYASAPAATPAIISGNPFAFLRLSSDMPGGIVSAGLYDLAPDFHCTAAGAAVGATQVSGGAADLRFHNGGYFGHPFPVDAFVPVRIDLANLAHVLEPGHRLAFALGYAGKDRPEHTRPAYLPRISISSDGGGVASHLVLPFVGGTLGGDPPTISYPPKPFLPDP